MKSGKPRRFRLGLAVLATWVVAIVFTFFLLSLAGCTGYNPSLYTGYDILNPSEAVRVNPLSTFPDPASGRQLYVVNGDFMTWVYELKAEVLKLRKGAR